MFIDHGHTDVMTKHFLYHEHNIFGPHYEGFFIVLNSLLRLTFTFVAGFTLTVTGGTFTLIGSHSVDAVTAGTKTWYCLALVHI